MGGELLADGGTPALTALSGLGLVARASASYAGYGPERAFDGMDTTSWYADLSCTNACCVAQGTWLEAEFPSPQTLGHVLLRGNRDGFPAGYDVLTGLFEVHLVDGGVTTVPFSTNRPEGDTLTAVGSAPLNQVSRVRVVIHATEAGEPGVGEVRFFSN